MDWIFDHPFVPDDDIGAINDVIASSGAILSGRAPTKWAGPQYGRRRVAPFGGRWSGPEFVLTHRPPSRAPRPGLDFLSGDIGEAVATGLRAAAGKNLLVLGADVAQQCLEADLVDEIVMLILPIVLGDSIRLFGRSGYREMLFDTVHVDQAGQAVILTFRRRP